MIVEGGFDPVALAVGAADPGGVLAERPSDYGIFTALTTCCW